MATSFLDKTGLTSLWAKIKATFALKSEVPDSTSDLTNDSGFIDSARFDIALEETYDSTTDTTTYTADKTYQQITDAIDAGKIPYLTFGSNNLTYNYAGIRGGEIGFLWEETMPSGERTVFSSTTFAVDNTNTWTKYDSNNLFATNTSDLINDSGFIDSARFDITLTDNWDDQTETHTYTADKTFQEIRAAINEGKVPYVNLYGELFLYVGAINFEGHQEYRFDHISSIVSYETDDFAVQIRSLTLNDSNTWTMSENTRYIPSVYELLPATTSTLGGVIVGDNINVANDGTISLDVATDAQVETFLRENGFLTTNTIDSATIDNATVE